MARNWQNYFGIGETETSWGTRIVRQGAGGTPNAYTGGYESPEYGGAGLIYLGSDSYHNTSTYARVNEDLMQASQYGTWDNLSGTLQSRLDELMNVSVDSWLEAYDVFDNIKKHSAGSLGLIDGPQGMYRYNQGGYPDPNFSPLDRHVETRRQYDESVARFNQIYSGALEERDRRDREHTAALERLDAQRRAAEAALARSQAWASNRQLHNRQTENIPDVVTSGTADAQDGDEGAVSQDIGGARRRRRRALSSNLGIQV